MPANTPASSPSSPASQRKWWVIGILGVSAGVALAIWFGVAASTGRPLWTDMGYKVQSDRSVRVTYDVTRPVGKDVTCTVRALDVHHGTVGSRTVQVPADDQKTTRRTTVVQTTTRAVTGVVDTCTYPEDAGSSS